MRADVIMLMTLPPEMEKFERKNAGIARVDNTRRDLHRDSLKLKLIERKTPMIVEIRSLIFN